MNKYTFLTLLLIASHTNAKPTATNETSVKKSDSKEEVIENPTLKTMSGSLNKWSLYSTYIYSGGSLEKPGDAERPNIRDESAQPNLANMSGVFGLKYRATKQDNFSIQLGLYSTTPFHSSLNASNANNQKDFDENHQEINSDDPVISYFRTYYLGDLQNISFFKYQYITRESYRDYGYRGVFQFSHAAAYRINKAAYIAGSFTYENFAYDKDTYELQGYEFSIRDRQAEHKLRANLSAEMYLSRKLSFRFITDLFSYQQMRDNDFADSIKKQQTVAMTYFFNRDISLAPNIRFIAEDLKPERTNVGLTLNVNI